MTAEAVVLPSPQHAPHCDYKARVISTLSPSLSHIAVSNMGNACSLHFFYCATTTASLSASASPINTQQSMIITFAIIFGGQ